MQEIRNKYKYPCVVEEGGKWGISIETENGGSSFSEFSTKGDAEDALSFARSIQEMGIALKVDIRIMKKKNKGINVNAKTSPITTLK